MHANAQKIGVLGLGYVGCVSAACLAELGHRVIGIDRDRHKVESLMQAKAPFYEPGLTELVARNVANGLLTATTEIEALRDVDLALVCVGTPSQSNGNINLEQLYRVAEQVGVTLAGRTKPFIFVIRSTVWPGTCEAIAQKFGPDSPIRVVSNPEFLREGSAVRDFLEPSLLVVGGVHRPSVEQVAALYAGLPVEACLVSERTSELIKYACNAFHAVKVTFANEMGALAEILEVSPSQVMETLCRDHKLNISTAYLKPGFAYGGSCLPKDLRALRYRAAQSDLRLPMLEAVNTANEEHLRRGVRSVLARPGRLGVFGLAFKENTDDVRESPVVTLLEQLLAKGRDVRVHDPHIVLDEIYGSNENFLLSSIPHIGRLLVSFEDMLTNSDHVIIAQRPDAERAAHLRSSGLPVLDLTGSWAPQ